MHLVEQVSQGLSDHGVRRPCFQTVTRRVMFLSGDAESGFQLSGCSIWDSFVEWEACSVYKEKIAAVGEGRLTRT